MLTVTEHQCILNVLVDKVTKYALCFGLIVLCSAINQSNKAFTYNRKDAVKVKLSQTHVVGDLPCNACCTDQIR